MLRVVNFDRTRTEHCRELGRFISPRDISQTCRISNFIPQNTVGCNYLLSGVPDYFDRDKILSGYDLSHYQVPHCIRVFFYFV